MRRANETERQVTVAVDMRPGEGALERIEVDADPMTRMAQVGREPPEFDHRDRAQPAAIDELGRFLFEVDIRVDLTTEGPVSLGLHVYDVKRYFRDPKQYLRRITIECPRSEGGYRIRLRVSTNIYVVEIESPFGVLHREVVPFTTGDLSFMVSADVLVAVASELSTSRSARR